MHKTIFVDIKRIIYYNISEFRLKAGVFMKNYKNKYFSILGDSISTFEGYTLPKEAAHYDMARKIESGVLTLADTWWGSTINHLQGEFLVNNSISGSTVCWRASYEVPSYGCSEERTSALDVDGRMPDVIMVYLGTNDWGAGIPIATAQAKKVDESNLALFGNAYKKMLKNLQKNYPKAEIWCLTLPFCCCSKKENFQFPYYYAGRNILDYNAAIRACAEEGNCRVVDLEKHPEMVDTMDGFHPNVRGMQTIANAVICAMTKE